MTTSKTIQYIIILFWSIWFTLVSLSDITNLLQVMHILPSNFAFSSKNYGLVDQFLSLYNINSFDLTLLLFSIIVLAATIISITFWIAMYSMSQIWINRAFLFSISFTMFFVLSDEVFIQYTIEHGHIIRLILLLITFMYFNDRMQAKNLLGNKP